MRTISSNVLPFIGMLATLILGLAVGATMVPQPAPPPKSNMALLGEVTTVVDPADPLVRELRADDARREAEQP